MRRPPAHCLLVITVLFTVAGAGCTTRNRVPGEDRPDPVGEDSAPTRAGAPADARRDTTPAPAAVSAPMHMTPTDDNAPGASPEVRPATARDATKPCVEPIEDAAGWLDRSHRRIFTSVCSTVAWFDGFFGNKHYDAASRETFGRIGISGFWDQRDGFDQRLRFRARLALPALSERTNLLVGRGDDREFIEEKRTTSNSIPSNFNNIEDDSFLVGLGYQREKGLKRGYSFSVGVKMKVPPEPFVKAKYRRSWELNDSTLLQLRPILYWKSDEGFGTTLNMDIDHMLSEKFMLRLSSNGNVSQDHQIEGVAWSDWLSLFQALANRKAISYHLFVQGESNADVPVQNYGIEMRFRRRIVRKWLFVEFITNLSWPREFLAEKRQTNIGVGAGVEMYFGPVPEWRMR